MLGTYVAYSSSGKTLSINIYGKIVMISEIVNRKTNIASVLKSLDAGMLRARTIANNVANVTTPGYKRVEVSFEDELRKALDRTRLKGFKTDSKHIDIGRKDIARVKPRAYRPNDPTLPSGVNNVDIDMEMAKLAENQLRYNLSLKFLKGAYSKLNAAAQAKSIRV